MRQVDADAIHAKLTVLYKNATGAARRAYSDALDIVSDADDIEDNRYDLSKTGHWTDVTFSFGEFNEADKTPIGLSIVSGRCSECEKYSENLMQYSPEMPEYCLHCGAAMEKG